MAQQEYFDLVIGGDVVLPDNIIPDGYIAIRREEIAAIGSGPPPLAHKTKSYPNSLLFPGLIDAQIHAGSFEGVEGLEDATRAAAAGGVTTVVDMPFDEPVPVNSVERLQTKIEAIGRLANVDVALYATAPEGRLQRDHPRTGRGRRHCDQAVDLRVSSGTFSALHHRRDVRHFSGSGRNRHPC